MSLLRDWRLWLFGLFLYLGFLVISLPAAKAYAWWQSSELAVPGLRLGDLSGSVWSGHAGQALINGQHLQAIDWEFQPLSLLGGEVGVRWRLNLPETVQGGYAQGELSLGADGSLRLPKVEGRLPAMWLASLYDAQAVSPMGVVSLNLQDLHWHGERLLSVTGRVVWSGAGVNLIKPVGLGDLSLELETVDGEVRGQLGDASGPLAVSGEASLRPDGNYRFSASLAARQGVAGASDLVALLNTLGRPGPDGRWRLQQSGNLAALRR